MKASEYFGDWMDVIDTAELRKILSWISTIDKTTLCPSSPNIFKAFRSCPLKDCKVVFLGQDPYPQQGVATGILFGNSKDTPEDKLSPSLQVVKEAAINYEIPHNRIDFDNTLESWAKQGILMINTAFTCEVGREDLATEYRDELEVLKKLLPEPVNEPDIHSALQIWCEGKGFIEDFYNEENSIDMVSFQIPKKEMGNAIKYLKSEFPQADGKMISEIVKKYIV
mgnify:CR=1 FL=1|jgi:hypothetical protein